MLRLKTVRWVWTTSLAAALACGAAAQTAGAVKQLAEGRQLRSQGRYAEARTVFQALLRGALTDAPDSRLAVVLDDLGIDEEDCGNYAEAEAAFNHALSTTYSSIADDPLPVALKTHLAELYTAELRPEAAEPLLRHAAAAVQSAALADRKALSVAYLDLAVTCTMLRRFQEAESILRQAQGLMETEYGPSHPALAAGLLSYAGLLTAEHRYAEAVVPAERAWQILQASPIAIPRPYLASALGVLGMVYHHTGRTAEAKSYARQAVDMAEASLGPQHPRLGLYLANYAAILKQAGHRSEAKAIRKRADEIRDQNPAAGTGYTINVAALR